MAMTIVFQVPQMGDSRTLHLAPGVCGIGLVATGSFPETSSPIQGEDVAKIEIVEATGTGPGASGEVQGNRPIATFYGVWRQLPPPAPARGRTSSNWDFRFVMIKYERPPLNAPADRDPSFRGLAPGTRVSLSLSDEDAPSHRLSGFVPEVVPPSGVDFIVLYMKVDEHSPDVIRRFPIPFPFFIDDREGDNLELVAIASKQDGTNWTEVGRSQILHLPCRRNNQTVTTTTSGDSDTYTDDLVGITVLHHRRFLVQAAVRQGHTWPTEMHYTPLEPGPDIQTFSPTAPPQIQIVLSDQLFAGRSSVDAAFVAPGTAACLDLVSTRLRDAGFAVDVQLRSALQATNPLVAQFDALPSDGVTDDHAVEVPYFTFFFRAADSLASIGLAEGFATNTTFDRDVRVDVRTPGRPRVSHETRGYRVITSWPIGSGTKRLTAPIRIRRGWFTGMAHESGAERAGKVLGAVVLHEVAHSFGMMHECIVRSPASPSAASGESLRERDAAPIDSVMCSATDGAPVNVEPYYSNQAKRIWQACFGIQPTYRRADFTSPSQVPSWNSLPTGTDRASTRVNLAAGEVETWRHDFAMWTQYPANFPGRANWLRAHANPPEPRFATDVQNPPSVDWRTNWREVSWHDRDRLIHGIRTMNRSISYTDRIRNPFLRWDSPYDG